MGRHLITKTLQMLEAKLAVQQEEKVYLVLKIQAERIVKRELLK